MKKKGKLIVIEGSDGSGKATQLELLKNYLESQNIPVQTVDFPQYHTSFFGKMIAGYLRGEYGPLEHIDPHLISVIYAMDRAQAKDQMDQWLSEGNIILANRYANSSMAHQASRLPKEKREEFINWLSKLEYEINKIPKENTVIYLHVPYKISQNLILQKNQQQRSYAHGKAKDIAEENLEHLRKSEEAYIKLAKTYPHWITIECVNKKGILISKENIHEEIKKILKEQKVINFR